MKFFVIYLTFAMIAWLSVVQGTSPDPEDYWDNLEPWDVRDDGSNENSETFANNVRSNKMTIYFPSHFFNRCHSISYRV